MTRIIIVTIFSLLSSPISPLSAKQKEVHLKWIHTSDVHGSLFDYDYLKKRKVSGGLSAVYAYVQDQRRTYGDRLLVTDGGDVLQGQPTAYYYNFVDTVSPHLVAEAMNKVGYVCGALGNHDVETGHEVYDRWIRECNFPILGANVIDVKTGKPYLQPYLVVRREGVKIAILGMITPAIPNWLPETLWSGLRFEEMVTSSRQWLRIIQEKEKPDLVVGIFHSGYDGGIITSEYHENAVRLVAEQVPGFDLICYGHDHHAQVHYLMNKEGGSVVTVGPTSQAYRIAEADITLILDKKGRVVEKRIEASTPFVDEVGSNDFRGEKREERGERNVLDLQNNTQGENVSSLHSPLSTLHKAPPSFLHQFEEAFASQRQTLQNWVDQPIGTLTKPLYERDAFFGPSEFIDLIHQMQLDLTEADISFVAPLSFDARLDSGTIRVSDMFAFYKYENWLYTMRLTGREVKNFLEMSYGLWTNQMTGPDDHILLLDSVLDRSASRQGDAFEESRKNGRRQGLKNLSYNMDSAAGILYTVDVSKPEGQRIVIESMADGTPFDLDRDYCVAINSYRGNGGGELITRGAGIPHAELKNRILKSTDKDLRYYLMQRIIKQKAITPVRLNHWRFIPDEWVKSAIERDRKILFPKPIN